MTLDDYLTLPYTIELTPDHDDEGRTGWVAEVEELPGCITQVDDLADLETSVRDAMAAWISVMLEDSRQIPLPRTPVTHSGRFLVRVPRTLHAELAHRAEQEGTSLNQLVVGLLAGAVSWNREREREVA